jgi:K+ transporter
METPEVMEGLRLACRNPELAGIDPDSITYYFRRVMVIPTDKLAGMAVWRKSLFATMHLNANLPAAYFGVRPPRSWRLASMSKSNVIQGRYDRGWLDPSFETAEKGEERRPDY